jgi:predicted DNA-binding transcriptional regulator AlpA
VTISEAGPEVGVGTAVRGVTSRLCHRHRLSAHSHVHSDETNHLIGIELLNASARLDADALETGTREIIVGVKEAAEMLGVEKSNFVRDYANKPDFPAPIAELASGRVWLRSAIDQYLRAKKKPRTKRLPEEGTGRR